MSKINKQTIQQPVYTIGGSFQALAIDHLTSDQSSDEDQINDEKSTNTTQNLISPQSKKAKAKQRGKDQARKLNQPSPSTTTKIINQDEIPERKHHIQSNDTPLQENIKPIKKIKQNPPKTTIEPIQKTQPIKPSTFTNHQKTQLNSNQIITKEYNNTPSSSGTQQQEDLNLQVTTSLTTSTTNSSTNSPSTSDLDNDDQEGSIEIDNNKDPLLNGSSNELKIQEVESKPKQYPNRSHPQPLSTGTPFTVQSIPKHRSVGNPPKSSINSPKINALNQSPLINQFGADHTPGKKWQTVLTRVVWSLVMVTGFITLMALGHLYLIILVFIIQLLVFREVTNLFQVGYKASAKEQARNQLQKQLDSSPSKSNSPSSTHHQIGIKEKKRIQDVGDKNRSNKIMSWYFFGVANYFLYGESIIYYFKHISYIDDWYLMQFGRHHRFISLLLYLIGFLGFVTNLDRGHLRRQFGLFSWIHMSLLLIIVFGQFMVNNVLEGLIWFWVPASLVIMNDVAAYVFGMLFGKHQLIKLSPKKTVEGFVGGFFMTVIFGVLWGSLFMGWNYMICPVKELGMTAFSDVQCDPNPVFKWRSLQLADLLTPQIHPIFSPIIDRILSSRFIPNQIWWTPFQLHCLVLATFAGLVAPFGGFFASGFKRAFNVKDFGQTIPGHGGLTDRFDCQFIMGLFTYFYYSSLVKEDESLRSLNKINYTVGSIMEIVSTGLNDHQQFELFVKLKNLLDSKGLL